MLTECATSQIMITHNTGDFSLIHQIIKTIQPLYFLTNRQIMTGN